MFSQARQYLTFPTNFIENRVVDINEHLRKPCLNFQLIRNFSGPWKCTFSWILGISVYFDEVWSTSYNKTTNIWGIIEANRLRAWYKQNSWVLASQIFWIDYLDCSNVFQLNRILWKHWRSSVSWSGKVIKNLDDFGNNYLNYSFKLITMLILDLIENRKYRPTAHVTLKRTVRKTSKYFHVIYSIRGVSQLKG